MSNVYNQNFNAGKLVATNVYLGVDASGNFVQDTSGHTASLQAVLVTTNSLTTNTINTDVFNFNGVPITSAGLKFAIGKKYRFNLENSKYTDL